MEPQVFILLGLLAGGCAHAKGAPAGGPSAEAAAAPLVADSGGHLPAASAGASREDRAEVVRHLDAIDAQLEAVTQNEMRGLLQNALAIQQSVSALEGPIRAFPEAARRMPDLRAEAQRFVEAARSGGHDEKHLRQDRVGEISAAIRRALP